jgi:hypothetical protein
MPPIQNIAKNVLNKHWYEAKTQAKTQNTSKGVLITQIY